MESVEDVARFIARLVGHAGRDLNPGRALGEQVELSSMQVIELAMALEQECGLDLPDDVDLRTATPAELFSPTLGQGVG